LFAAPVSAVVERLLAMPLRQADRLSAIAHGGTTPPGRDAR
jgi:hypothetical protein